VTQQKGHHSEFNSESTTIANLTKDGNNRTIIIDINGSKAPNTFGKDVFLLIRDEEAGSIIPYCSNRTQANIEKSCLKRVMDYAVLL
jgi:hypothetical protein